jgi:signal transduction histidine kinase
MDIRGRLSQLTSAQRLPKRTVRLRLTVLYGSVFLLAGAGLVAISYLLVNNRLHNLRMTTSGPLTSKSGPGIVSGPRSVTDSLRAQQATDLHQFLVQSLIALGVMAVVSVLLGWLVAGRALHPIRTMTARARGISERNLHERLAVAGPGDELKALGDTIDGLLTRLEAAFNSQRQFVANASHELRTPLMLEQTMLQVALADPHLTLNSLSATCEEVIQAGKQQERLLQALLTLARSQRGLDQRQPVDVAETTKQVLNTYQAAVESKALRINPALRSAVVSGDDQLIGVLVSNLLDNAIRYNRQGGSIDVDVATSDGQPTLAVTNTGNLVPADQVDRLLQPFQRLDGDRAGTTHDGLGLGLSIVEAIVTAHDATVSVSARPGGGLTIRVSFPPETTVSSRHHTMGRRARLPSPVQDSTPETSRRSFRNRPTCPACGSTRTATLDVLRTGPPGQPKQCRRCRACGHDWEQVTE